MSTVAVLGATGFTGRLLATTLVERGHAVVLVGRDGTALETVAASLGDAVVAVRTAGISDGDPSDRLVAATDGVDAIASAVGGDGEVVHAVRTAAVRAGRPLVDTAADVAGVRRAVAELDDEARAAGLPVVPGVGWHTAPGDLLAAVTARRLERPRDVHVAYVVPDRGGVLAASSRGSRFELVGQLAVPTGALVDGETSDERPGEQRRLAWFPRPVGPHHAAGVAGLEPLSVPRHVPGVRTVRTYLAVSSLRAEVLQAVANLSRWDRTRRTVERALVRGAPGDGPPPQRRRASRWACVVEVAGDDGLARGWANGRDPHGVTALTAAVVTESLLAGRAAAGVLPPALAGVADDLLDAVAGASDVRWSATRIEPDG